MQRRNGLAVGILALISCSWSLFGGACVPGLAGGEGSLGGGLSTNLPPIAVITQSLTGGVAPLRVTFSSDQSTDDGLIVSREWDFGDGATSLEVAPTHTFETTGTYAVTLTLRDERGATSTATTEVVVTQAPVAVISVDRTTLETAPATVNFSAAGSFDPDGQIVAVNWDFGDGSRETLSDVAHTFSRPGTFRVRLTVTDDVGITATDDVLVQVGIKQPQLEIRIPSDNTSAVVIPQDGQVWIQAVFSVEEGVPYSIRAGLDLDADPSNNNDIQLDTDPPSGNDLNITYGAALELSDVDDLNGSEVPPGEYRLWAEIDTDQTDPVRVYAAPVITIIEPLPDTNDGVTPLAPLTNDQAMVLVSPTKPRQVFDLGPVGVGDRLFLSFAVPPELKERFDPGRGVPYSLMLLDENSEIFAWYQRRTDEDFVLFARETRLIVSRPTISLKVVVDGGIGINVRIQRAAQAPDPRQQRVFIDFRGSGAIPVQIGDEAPLVVPQFNARDLNPAWGTAETTAIKQAVVDRVRELYAAYDVVITSSEDGPPAPPYQTLYIGGFHPFLAGTADYSDPRNDTAGGFGVIYATSIGDAFFGSSAATVGLAIGTATAHEIGHLLGLRHTDSVSDLMGRSISLTDPGLAFESARVSALEQLPGLPPLGIQNAPVLLQDTVGLAP